MRDLAAVLTEALVVVFAVLFAALAWTRRTDPAALARALLAPVMTGAAYLVSELIKSDWQVDRPCRALATIATCPEAGDWSFPSNHATVAGAAAVAVLWSSRTLGALAVAVALVEVASRVFVGGARRRRGGRAHGGCGPSSRRPTTSRSWPRPPPVARPSS